MLNLDTMNPLRAFFVKKILLIKVVAIFYKELKAIGSRIHSYDLEGVSFRLVAVAYKVLP